MGRMAARRGYWVYLGGALAGCAALVACSVETTTIQRRVDPTEPAVVEEPGDDPNGAAPGSSGSSGGTSSSGGSGTPARDSGTSSGSSGGAKDSGAPDTGSSGSSGTPSQFDAFQQKNLALINQYRATKSLTPIVLDAKISTFAYKGTQQLIQDHTPHAHFAAASANGSIWQNGFTGSAAENQGDPNGWFKMSNDPVANQMLQIADIQKAMFDEGPGPGAAHGHYMNMMNPVFRKVGIGLIMVNSELYLTNDFSQ